MKHRNSELESVRLSNKDEKNPGKILWTMEMFSKDLINETWNGKAHIQCM